MENVNKYNAIGTDLRKMQLKMLEMLEFLDYICQKYSIPYWLGAGTLLGAVRHGGFIPWDDDLDIEMQKHDYKKLLKVLKTEMSDKYILQVHQSDRNYIFPIAKFRDKNSHISELHNADKNYKYHNHQQNYILIHHPLFITSNNFKPFLFIKFCIVEY